MSKFPITQTGFTKLEQEIKQLKFVDRPAVIKEIATAREFGDLSENAEYHAAKEKQSYIEGRILNLEDKISRAEIIDISKLSGSSVKFGATVKLVDEDTEEEAEYHIVGEYEADITKKRISIQSPLAKSLIGKIVGDSVEVPAPSGTKAYEILKITYKNIDLD